MGNTTGSIQEARAALVALEAEKGKRAVEAANADRQAKQLRQTISRLVGSMQLDGSDFTSQIATARADLAKAEQIVRLWPDVEAELERRIEEARGEVKRHELQLKLDSLHDLASEEERLRQQFYAKGLEFLEVADQLVGVTERKEATRREVNQAGGPTRDVPYTEHPPFFPGWPRVGNGVQLAREAWKLD